MNYELYERVRGAQTPADLEALGLTEDEWFDALHSIALQRDQERAQASYDQALYDRVLQFRKEAEPGRARIGELMARELFPEPSGRCPACAAALHDTPKPRLQGSGGSSPV